MPSDIAQTAWSEVDSGNNNTPPLGWPTNMLPNAVEPSARMMMGAMKRYWNKANPVYPTTQSTADSYVFTPTNAGDGWNLYEQVELRVNIANASTSPTLSIGGIPFPIRKMSGSSPTVLAAGDLRAQAHTFFWDGTRVILRNPNNLNGQGFTGNIGPATLVGTITLNNQSFSGTCADGGIFTTIDINGGTIDGAVIGGASAAAITGTTITGGSFRMSSAGQGIGLVAGGYTGFNFGDGTISVFTDEGLTATFVGTGSVNRNFVFTGSNGGNCGISVSAGSLSFDSVIAMTNQSVAGSVATASTHRLNVTINGTAYGLLMVTP